VSSLPPFVTCICKTCQKPFDVKRAQYERQGATWCSWTCRSAGVIVKCDICDKEFRLKPSHANKPTKYGKFCSRHCRAIGTHPTGADSPIFSQAECTCFICGKRKLRPLHLKDRDFVCSPACHREYQSIRNTGRWVGPNSGTWKGGASIFPYPVGWTVALRRAIRKRDGHVCRICGVSESRINSVRLHVHHIDYDKSNIVHSNLASVCELCHGKTNFNRSYWTQWFAEHPALLFRPRYLITS
jgi:hypothetical protein